MEDIKEKYRYIFKSSNPKCFCNASMGEWEIHRLRHVFICRLWYKGQREDREALPWHWFKNKHLKICRAKKYFKTHIFLFIRREIDSGNRHFSWNTLPRISPWGLRWMRLSGGTVQASNFLGLADLKKYMTWELRVKFCLGRNEACSLETAFQIAPRNGSKEVGGKVSNLWF